MTALAMCWGLLVACSTASVPKELSVEVRVCKGDPLGTGPGGFGETSKYRISANAPDDQVWVEVTVRAAGAAK